MLQGLIPGGFQGSLSALQWGAALLAFFLLLVPRKIEPERRTVVYLGVFWVLFITVEYWGLGPYSAMTIEDEGDFSIPLLLYLTRTYDGTQLIHGWGMDQDVYSITDMGMSFFSLERMLFYILPLWIAMAVHKLSVAAVGFAGAYVLARRAGGADRWAALALAAWYTLAFGISLQITLVHGLGYAVTALAVYVLVFRLEKSNYCLGVACVVIVHAISVSIAHSTLAVGMAVVICWIFINPIKPLKFIAACSVMIGLAAANWLDVINALALNGPQSYRGTEFNFGQEFEFSRIILEALVSMPEAYFIVAISLFVLAIRKDFRLIKAIAMLVAASALTFILLAVPWSETRLPMLKAFDFSNVLFGLNACVVLIGAWASHVGDYVLEIRGRSVRVLANITVAIAIGMMVSAKGFNASQWLARGNLAHFDGYANLAERDWEPQDRLFRVATIPYRITPNIVASYGLETVDTLLNVVPRDYGMYFEHGFPGGMLIPHYYITSHRAADFLCCREYDLEKLVDLDLLKLANTEFVISVLPLKGPGLQLVSGPPENIALPRRDDSLVDKVTGFLASVFQPPDVYVYKIPNPIPRAYIAQYMTLDNSPDLSPDYYRFIAGVVQAGGVVLPKAGAKTFDVTLPVVGDIDIEKARNGYDLSILLETNSIVVVNTVWSPFWTASFNGQPLSVTRANGIHTAIIVPSGTGIVQFRYLRPTAGQRIAAAIGS